VVIGDRFFYKYADLNRRSRRDQRECEPHDAARGFAGGPES